MLACRIGNDEILKLLLNANANVNQLDKGNLEEEINGRRYSDKTK